MVLAADAAVGSFAPEDGEGVEDLLWLEGG
jgi:hypothetical protein